MEQPNGDYIIQSLRNQLADRGMDIASRDAVITEQYQRIDELEKELEEYRKNELEEMDSAE